MRALFIDTSPFTGGAQRSLFGLLSELKRDSAYGIDPYLLTADDSDAGLATQARSMGIDTGMIPTRNWPRTWRGLDRSASTWAGPSKAVRNSCGAPDNCCAGAPW